MTAVDNSTSAEWDELGRPQNTPEAKAAWKVRMRVQYPVGSRVRVTESDEAEYVGLTGRVLDYDVGCDADTWPLIGVGFDAPPPGKPARDGFYESELAMLRTITISLAIETSDGAAGIEGVMEAADAVLDNGTLQDAILAYLEDNGPPINMEIVSATAGYAPDPEPPAAVVAADVECPSCKRQPDEKNHPPGMVFVGWGRGWETCSRCGGTARVRSEAP